MHISFHMYLFPHLKTNEHRSMFHAHFFGGQVVFIMYLHMYIANFVLSFSLSKPSIAHPLLYLHPPRAYKRMITVRYNSTRILQ